jgi:hypothetical protein
MPKRLFAFALLLSSVAFAGELEDLQKTTKIWQHQFGMDSWTVTVSTVTQDELRLIAAYGGDIDAASLCSVDEHTCWIYILRRDAYTSEHMKVWGIKGMRGIRRDQRNSVVHELLHNVIGNGDEEWAVQLLAHLLSP